MNNEISEVPTSGVHHIGLTAPDVTFSSGFFVNTQGKGGNRHMTCTMPGGIRLELIAPRQ